MNNTYVYDTYALMEIIAGNPNYKKYIDGNIIITEFILGELCFNLIRIMDTQKAFTYVDNLADYVVSVDKEIIKKAMLYKRERLKSNISMTDCIGYALSISLGVKFLTGDMQFKGLPNVEYVK